jgi:hypothetical protein
MNAISERSKRNLREWKRGFEFFAAHPDANVTVGWANLCTREQFLQEFRAALHAKINAAGRLPIACSSWRKLDPDYQTNLRRDAQNVNGRSRFYQFNLIEMRNRFAHLLSDRNEV